MTTPHSAPETFTDEEIKKCIDDWLDFGEKDFVLNKKVGEPGQMGYFSGMGWAARCLRFHLEQLNRRPSPPPDSLREALEELVGLIREGFAAPKPTVKGVNQLAKMIGALQRAETALSLAAPERDERADFEAWLMNNPTISVARYRAGEDALFLVWQARAGGKR